MEYAIAVVMGYFVGTNALVNKQARGYFGEQYAHPALGLLSALGFFGGWFCIIPAAFFVSHAYDNGIFQGVLFCVVALGGSLLSGFAQITGVNYYISAATLFVNSALAAVVYVIAAA